MTPPAALRSVAFLCVLSGLDLANAQTWMQTGAPSNRWAAIACSADGLNLVAASGGQSATGQVYISSNGGTNWTPTAAPLLRWTSVASSADGTRLAAVAYSGWVYTSTNSGATWTSNNLPSASWLSVASSADGSQLFAVPYGNLRVYHSSNGGVTWITNTSGLADLLSVATSANGTLVLAGDNHFHVQVSTNAGTTWSSYTTLNGVSGNVSCVNVSGAGQRLTAVTSLGGPIFSSANLGGLWFSNGVPPNSSWLAASSSADGTRLIVIGQKGPVYCSMDSGGTWVSNSAPTLFWAAVASSADGNLMFVAPSNGSIWVRRTNAPPVLGIGRSSNSLSLSWVTQSSALVLQQSPDLTANAWTDVTNPPVLDLSTLRQHVTLPANAPNQFYRLKSR